MNRNQISILAIIIVTIVLSAWLLIADNEHAHGDADHGHGHDEAKPDVPKGPQGGRLLTKDDFALEISIFESGVPPEFHIYAYHQQRPIDPNNVVLNIKLHRTGNKTDDINFVPQQAYLKGDKVIVEPHSFAVEVQASYAGKDYHWRYDNFEGRTQIPDAMADMMNIKTEIVGPVKLQEIRSLSGQVHTNPNLLSHVRARYTGMVKTVRRELGEQVKAGDVLATVQSNESLQTYSVKAPISGVIVQRDIQVGESTGDAALFIIADLSRVWVELDVFNRDLGIIKTGQQVVIETLDGQQQQQGKINWISPLAAHASQSVRARIQLDNSNGALRPGQFIRGHVSVAEHAVPLAVRQSAIQTFRDFQVVYAKFGDTYEVRMLELGRRNNEWVEVLSGIDAGTNYVTENSYLIKADIEKSGASHDH